MFEGLIKDAQSAAVSLVDRYLARASVAVPFVVALGFATAALAVDLTARYGPSKAFWIMAAGFCTIGLIGGLTVMLRERETAAVEAQQAAESEQQQSGLGELGDIASEAATQAAGRIPMGLLAPLLASPSASAMGAVRLIGRHLPLLVLAALVVLLFALADEPPKEADEEAAEPPVDPEAPQPPAPGQGQDPLREAA